MNYAQPLIPLSLNLPPRDQLTDIDVINVVHDEFETVVPMTCWGDLGHMADLVERERRRRIENVVRFGARRGNRISLHHASAHLGMPGDELRLLLRERPAVGAEPDTVDVLALTVALGYGEVAVRSLTDHVDADGGVQS